MEHLYGWSLAEASAQGYNAKVRIYHGKDATGPLLASITLESNESVRDWLLPEALPISSFGVPTTPVTGNGTIVAATEVASCGARRAAVKLGDVHRLRRRC